MMRAAIACAILVVLPALPPAASQGTTTWPLADAAGDVVLVAGDVSSPALPLQAFLTHVDMTSVNVEDADEERLIFTLKTVQGFEAAPSGDEGIAFDIRQRITFGYEGSPKTAMIQVTSWPGFESGSGIAKMYLRRAVICFSWNDLACTGQSVAGLRIVEGAAEVTVDKARLAAALQVPRLEAGAPLTSLSVVANTSPAFVVSGSFLTPRLQDWLPDRGKPAASFVLRYPSAPPDFHMNATHRRVVAGEEFPFQLEVFNGAVYKRRVNFSVEALLPGTEGWSATITPGVLLAARRATNITVRVQTPPLGDKMELLGALRIKANLVNDREVFSRTLMIQAVPPADERHAMYHLHHQAVDGTQQVAGRSTSNLKAFASRAVPPPALTTYPIPFRANVLPVGGSVVLTIDDLSGFPHGVVLSANASAKANLVIESPIGFEAALSILVHDQRGLPLLQGQRAVAITSGQQTISLPLLPSSGSETRATHLNDRLGFLVALTPNPPTHIAVANVLSLAQVKLLPRTSSIEIPWTREFAAPPGAQLARVVLAPNEDLDAFVNPGRQQVFELDVRNEDERRHDVEIAIENATLDWPTTILPGIQLRLPPGESVHLGVVVRAPAAAAEGDTFRAGLLVRDEQSRVLSRQTLRLTATNGAEIDNETFTGDAEDLRRLRSQATTETPSLAFWEAVMAAFALVLARRGLGPQGPK